MPILASLMSALFGKIFTWLGARISYQIAFGVAVSGAVVGGFAALKASLVALSYGIAYAMPDVVSNAFAMFMPNNMANCISVVLVADSIKAAWTQWKMIVFAVANGSK